MIRCVLYARTSSVPRNRQSFSIESQLDDMREYVRRLPGAIIVAEITDPDEKGPLSDRPGLNGIRAMAHRHEFDLLVVHDMERVARKLLLQLTLEEELQGYGVQIVYVTTNYSDDDEGRLQKNIRASVSEYERAKIQERTLRGKRRKAKEGLVPGGGRTAYGYQYDGDGHLVVVPEQAAVVQLVFQMYVQEEKSLEEVAAELERRRIPTHQRKGKWHRGTLRTILRNETYAGTGYYNRLRTIVPYGKKRRPRPREEWIAFATPALVDRATWEAAQQRLERNRTRCRKKPRAPFLLAGMIRCAPCDRAYSGSDFNGWRNYRDNGPGRHKCLSALRVETAVWGAIRALLLDPTSILLGYQRLQERQAKQDRLAQAEGERLQRRLAQIQTSLDELTLLHLSDKVKMSEREYLRLRGRLLDEQTALEQQAQPAPAVLPLFTPRHFQAAEECAAQVAVGIDLLEQPAQRVVLQRLRLQVLVHPGERLELSGLFPVVLEGTCSRSARRGPCCGQTPPRAHPRQSQSPQ